MARSTFKTLFYINRSKEKKNGKCPIMGRITIDGEQVQYSTGKEIAPELWDSRKGRCKGIGEETKEISRYLQTKEEQAKGKYQELVWQRGYITAELLKRELTNIISQIYKIGVLYNEAVKTLNCYHSTATAQRMLRKIETYSEAIIKLQMQAIKLTEEYSMIVG